MIEVKNLSKVYRMDLFGKKTYTAVKTISFQIQAGETLGIIGESGCGKSTVAKMVSRVVPETSGSILLNGNDVSRQKGADRKVYHKAVQIMFQNPETALDPNMTIGKSILEAIRNYKIVPQKSKEESELLKKLVAQVGLLEEHLSRYPWELSGGQIQRAVLARVIALSPQVLIADEPTSMLDVSVQAQILTLIKELQKRQNFGMLFISHDLDVVKTVCDRVLVMNRGEVVEQGDTEKIFSQPECDYTKALLRAFYY